MEALKDSHEPIGRGNAVKFWIIVNHQYFPSPGQSNI